MSDHWYLAAPFFNAPQIDLCERIETAFKLKGLDLYSPRQYPSNKIGPPDYETSKLIFQKNVDEILKCSHMLAVMDWLLPEGQQLRSTTGSLDGYLSAAGPPLNIPDVGTVWEAGFAYGYAGYDSDDANDKIWIYGYTEQDEEKANINLMLTRCMDGVIFGFPHLRAVISGETTPREWRGRNR